jgi:murein DD-endopeptidase MepM/ murein hydrolase activator NlpD
MAEGPQRRNGRPVVPAALGVRPVAGIERRGYLVDVDEYVGPQGTGFTISRERRKAEERSRPEARHFVLRAELVGEAAGSRLAQAADQVREAFPAAARRERSPFDGFQAVVHAGLPGLEERTRVTLVSAHGRLYRVTAREDPRRPGRPDESRLIEFFDPGSLAMEDLHRAPADAADSLRPAAFRDLPVTAPEKGRGLPAPDHPPAGTDEEFPRRPQAFAAAGGCVDYAGPAPLQTPWTQAANGGSGFARAGPSYYGQNFHEGCSRPLRSNDHHALDFSFNIGDPILPNAVGTVLYAGWAGGGWNFLGRVVIVDIGGGYWSLAAHLSGIAVAAGRRVGLDSVLGWAGDSGGFHDGFWRDPHLHNVIYKDAQLDPNLGGIHSGRGVEPIDVRFFGNGGGVVHRITEGQRLSW